MVAAMLRLRDSEHLALTVTSRYLHCEHAGEDKVQLWRRWVLHWDVMQGRGKKGAAMAIQYPYYPLYLVLSCSTGPLNLMSVVGRPLQFRDPVQIRRDDLMTPPRQTKAPEIANHAPSVMGTVGSFELESLGESLLRRVDAPVWHLPDAAVCLSDLRKTERCSRIYR